MKEIIANKQHNASVDCCLYEQTNALLLYGPLHPNSEHPDHIPEISARFDAVNVKKKKKSILDNDLFGLASNTLDHSMEIRW